MSAFWSAWIIVLTSITLIGTTWLLIGNSKVTREVDEEDDGKPKTTGHVFDGIEEYDNPLPRWWFNLFILSIVFSVGYLIVYPGMGNFKGLFEWTQINQWDRDVTRADRYYGELYKRFTEMPVEELAENRKALKMGQRLFSSNCSVCHGTDARGAYGFPNLTDGDWLYGGSAEKIKESIQHGRKGAMPAWDAVLDDQGVRSLTEYVLQISGQEANASQAKDGEKTFATYCASCHGADGSGNTLLGAPNLTDDIWLYGGDRVAIQHSIRRGRNGNMPAQKDQLGEGKIQLLAAYVYRLSNPTEKVEGQKAP